MSNSNAQAEADRGPGSSALPPTASLRRWVIAVSLVLVLQLAFIVWLSDSEPLRPRPAPTGPSLQLVNPAAVENLGLTDPTLFALPHPHAFSGLSWLKVPSLRIPSFDQSEPPYFFPLPNQPMLEVSGRFVLTNSFDPLAIQRQSEAETGLPELVVPDTPRAYSTCRLEGALAQRRLLSRLELRAWQHTDLLTNSIVQMVADAAGEPVSLTLLPPGSGLPAADQEALALARAARFEPVPVSGRQTLATPLTHLSWGWMVFEWHTLISSNSPAGPP